MQLPSLPSEAVALMPKIEVSDFARTMHFYVEVLGFSVVLLPAENVERVAGPIERSVLST